MKILKKIDPENKEKTIKNWRKRYTARAVVINKKGDFGVILSKKQKRYKLPGGGIDKGERKKSALKRECLEELGVKIKILKEIGIIEEFRKDSNLHQISYCFLAQSYTSNKPVSYSEQEKLIDCEPKWINKKDIIKLFSLKQKEANSPIEEKIAEERDRTILLEAFKKLPDQLF